MHHSLTWQSLPKWLLKPVLRGHLSLLEASELFDHWLLTPPGEFLMMPQRLWPAAQKVFLSRAPCPPTKH